MRLPSPNAPYDRKESSQGNGKKVINDEVLPEASVKEGRK